MRKILNPVLSLTLLFATNPTTIDSTQQDHNGYLQNVYVTVPALDGVTTATLNIKDAQGNVVYTKNSLAAGATTLCTPTAQVPIAGVKYEIVTSGNQTANRVFAIQPYIDSLVQ